MLNKQIPIDILYKKYHFSEELTSIIILIHQIKMNHNKQLLTLLPQLFQLIKVQLLGKMIHQMK